MPGADDVPPEAWAAWGAFLRAHAELVRRMDAALQERTGMPLQWYDVLRNIAGARGGTTMRELDERVLLSQSGLSRLVGRLVDAGLVSRSPSADDRRSVELALTALGRARLRAAKAVMARQVRQLFASRMDEAEAAVLLDVFRRLTARPRAGTDEAPVGE